jgi:isopentenyl phosphate kinase
MVENSLNEPLLFLKLGGSLITDKAHPHTHLPSVLNRVAEEIAAAWEQIPGLRLVVGHGSGSFGHIPGLKYGTRQGVRNERDWAGFTEVWSEARALNQLVLEALQGVSLPVIAFPPSSGMLTCDGQPLDWDIRPLQSALQQRLLPLVNGDVAFDTQRGGTIVSTEDIFLFLAPLLQPQRILLAGIEDGVWVDFPRRSQLAREITPGSYTGLGQALAGSQAVDVTGGMQAKVVSMLELSQQHPGLEVWIFSGKKPDAIHQALIGVTSGTRIHA